MPGLNAHVPSSAFSPRPAQLFQAPVQDALPVRCLECRALRVTGRDPQMSWWKQAARWLCQDVVRCLLHQAELAYQLAGLPAMLEPAMPCVPQYQQLALQICLGCQHCQWAEGFSTSRPAMFDPRWHGPTPSCISKQLGSSSSYAAQKAVCANSPTSPVLSRTPRPKVQIEDVHQPKGAFARVEPARGRATPPSQAGRRQSPALSRAQFSSCARFRRPTNVFNSIFNTRAILRRPAAPQSALPPPSAPAANLRPTFTPASRKPWFRSHDCGCRPGMGRGFRWG